MRKSTLLMAVALCVVNMGFAQKSENLIPLNVSVDEITPMELPVQRPTQQFNFLKANNALLKSTAATAALDAPVATEATDVKDGSFIANWEAVDGADGYYLQVVRDLKSSADAAAETMVFHLYEDCRLTTPGVVAKGNDAKFLLNEGQTMRDWILYNGETVSVEANGETYGAIDLKAGGMLFSPPLDYSNEAIEGSTAIFCSFTGLASDSLYWGMYVIDGGQQQNFIVYQAELTQDMLDKYGGWPYELTFQQNPTYEQMGFFFFAPETNQKNITIDRVYSYQNMAPGKEWNMLFAGIETTECSQFVYTLEYDDNSPGITEEFYYGVMAYTTDIFGQQITDQSDFSNIVVVGETGAIEGVVVSKDKVFVSDKLHVVLEAPAQVSVYNITGALVGSYQGVVGDNEIELPAGGVYVVKAGKTVVKVVK